MMYNIQKSKGVIYMKKVLFLLIILFGAFNSFSAHILNGKNSGMFTDKEMMSLVSGNYNTDVQLAVVSKARGSNQESTTKAENDARLTLQTTIKEYLKETEITGQNFEVKKMKDIADQIAKEALLSATQKGKWITGRNDTVMLYLIEKETVRKMSAKAFRERLTNLIEKLTEYRGVFETLKIPGGN